MPDAFLGRTTKGEEVRLPFKTFLRHAICLGNAGSGKTVTCKVLCEEFIRNGTPVIAVDPQGDIASLGQVADEAEVVSKGVSADIRKEYADKAEVVVWTPGSSLGVPLSVNPLSATRQSGEGVAEEDVLRERSFAAEALADLAGFDLRSKDGLTVTTLFNLVIAHASEKGQPLDGISGLLRLLEGMPSELRDRVSSVVDEKILGEAVRRTRMLTIGSQSMLLTGGVPLDIDCLLGKGDKSGTAPGKTRLSVIYINMLPTDRERQFFVGQLVQALHRWMLKHPNPEPQALFYIDEISPYLPPVRKPVCKDALGLLFRQARKYGVSCLAATQSPGDIDYKALGQISTWNLGRLVVRQEVKKIEGQLKAVAPEAVEDITRRLPALAPGQSILFSPDVFPGPVEMQTRWLVTWHKTLNEQEIAAATEPTLRQRLEATIDQEIAPGEETAKPDESLAGPAVGRAEVAVLAVTNKGEGAVGACEIVVRRGGSGKITALGGQTKVSKESIKVAWEAASQLQVELDLPRNFARSYDVTVLDARLAVKKDGPSAGLAYLTGIVAAFRGAPPRPDLAMTGEITILGKVLAVGGILEKVRAAYEIGYATVLVPAENRGDVEMLPADLRQAIEVVSVATVQEALPVIFAAPHRARPEPPKKLLTPVPASVEKESQTDENPATPKNAKLQALADAVQEFLKKEPVAFSYAEIADRLGEPVASVTKVVQQLTQDGVVKTAKRSRLSVYFHADHPLRPEFGLYGPVEAVKMMILEPEARRRAEYQLNASLGVFVTEEIVSQRLAYLPLYRIHFVATVQEGWIFVQEVERRDNLYFSGTTAELLSYVEGTGFTFTPDVPSNPTEVIDLDNVACFETRSPGDLELDDAEMNALVGEKAAEASAKRKFQLSVLDTSLVFLPVWRFVVRDTQTNSEREVNIDGLKGEPIVLSRTVAARKKK